MANPEDNGAFVAPGNRPTFWYTLILLWFYLFIIIYLPCLSSVRIVLSLVAMIFYMSFLHSESSCSVRDDLYSGFNLEIA
jgi:hypothetical protein